MEKRDLIDSSLQVSVIGFGAASISGEGGGYGFGEISLADAVSLVQEAYELGINLFDTAPIYGFGESERRLGLALKQVREKVVLVSKSGVSWHDNQRVNLTNDPKITQKMLEDSLRNLQTEYIDVYMIHWPDPLVDIRRPMEVLAKAKREGKIKHIGLCNTTVSDYQLACEVDHVEVLQSELNVLKRQWEEEILPLVQKNNLGFMSWGTLEKGILTGKVTKERTFSDLDCRKKAPWFKKSVRDPLIEKFQKIEPKLQEHGVSGLEFALGFNLSFKELSCALVGARNSAQLEGVLKALENRASSDFVQEVLAEVEM